MVWNQIIHIELFIEINCALYWYPSIYRVFICCYHTIRLDFTFKICLQCLFDAMDADGDNKISKDEFSSAMAVAPKLEFR